MPASIVVEKTREREYRVSVTEGGSQSVHRVTVHPDYHEELTGGTGTPEALVRRSFEFLLEREPKESILQEFDLKVISRYFPEYEREIRTRSGE